MKKRRGGICATQPGRCGTSMAGSVCCVCSDSLMVMLGPMTISHCKGPRDARKLGPPNCEQKKAKQSGTSGAWLTRQPSAHGARGQKQHQGHQSRTLRGRTGYYPLLLPLVATSPRVPLLAEPKCHHTLPAHCQPPPPPTHPPTHAHTHTHMDTHSPVAKGMRWRGSWRASWSLRGGWRGGRSCAHQPRRFPTATSVGGSGPYLSAPSPPRTAPHAQTWAAPNNSQPARQHACNRPSVLHWGGDQQLSHCVGQRRGCGWRGQAKVLELELC